MQYRSCCGKYLNRRVSVGEVCGVGGSLGDSATQLLPPSFYTLGLATLTMEFLGQSVALSLLLPYTSGLGSLVRSKQTSKHKGMSQIQTLCTLLHDL